MSEHFLLTRFARDLPVTKVIRMSEDAAYNWFRRARWPLLASSNLAQSLVHARPQPLILYRKGL